MTTYRDAALNKAFPSGLRAGFGRGTSNTGVVAVQYALGRLGHLHDLCDGKFGGNTEAAVQSFQRSAGLAVTGFVDERTVSALDTAVAGLDLRPPAAKAADPLAYLSDFRALRQPEIRLNSTSESYSWGSPHIQSAYGTFVANYWEVIKQNRVEADCKGLALFLMDQFRKQLREDRLINLPHPVLRGARERAWIVATNNKTRGLFSRADILRRSGGRVNRPGYVAMQKIEALDPQFSMLPGVAVHYPEISAHQVARSCTRLFNWNPALSNRGDSSKPEVPVNALQPGHLIFIDHTGNGSFDHTVSVIQVERDAANRTRKLILAVGSFDDVRDTSSETEPNQLSLVNTYSEEVTVELDTSGRVARSVVSWSSEPDYIVPTRYSARTTLMEQRGGGTLFVGRWG